MGPHIPPPLVDLLGLTVVFGDLSPGQRAELSRLFRMRAFASGDILIRQGDDGGSVLVLAEGELDVVAEVDGRALHLARLGPGEVLGEANLVAPGPRVASVAARRAGALWSLDVDRFAPHRESPLGVAVLMGLARLEASRLRGLDQRIADLAPEPAPLPRRAALVERPEGRGPGAPADPRWAEVVRRSPLWPALGADGAAALVAELVEHHLEPGARLFSEGAPGRAVYLLARGAVEVAVARGRRHQRLDLVGAGRLVGAASLLDGAPRSATCAALEPTVALELPASGLDALLRRCPAAGAAVLEALHHELSAAVHGARRLLSGLEGGAPEGPPLGAAPRGAGPIDAPFAPEEVLRADHTTSGAPPLAAPPAPAGPLDLAALRAAVGAAAGDRVALVPGAPADALLQVLIALEAGPGAVLLLHRALAAALAGPAQGLGVRVEPLSLLHDGDVDLRGLEAALVRHGAAPLKLVAAPSVDPASGVALGRGPIDELLRRHGACGLWDEGAALLDGGLPAVATAALRRPDARAFSCAGLPGVGGLPTVLVLRAGLGAEAGLPDPADGELAAVAAAVAALGPSSAVARRLRQDALLEGLVQAWRGAPGLRLVGGPEAPRRASVVLRVRGPGGSVGAREALAQLRAEGGLRAGLDPDGGALRVDVGWWWTDAQAARVQQAVLRLGRSVATP
jgi:CRP-like cAMP-binding protein